MIKKLFAALLTVIFAFTPFSLGLSKAEATQTYGRAVTQDVGFYKNPDATELLFYLPYTYYVKITEYGAVISRAEIFSSLNQTPAIDGYVYTDELYFEDATPSSPFYELTLTTATATPFYADSAATTVTRYVFENRTLLCYGSLKTTSGAYLYYVCYNGDLGYVKEEHITPFVFVNHPTPLPVFEEEKPQPNEPVEKKSDSGQVLKIAIIAAVALAAVTILAFALKPEKKERDVAFYDDNDYD